MRIVIVIFIVGFIGWRLQVSFKNRQKLMPKQDIELKPVRSQKSIQEQEQEQEQLPKEDLEQRQLEHERLKRAEDEHQSQKLQVEKRKKVKNKCSLEILANERNQ